MITIPAIDLKDGKVVRLVQGRCEEFTVYSHDPVEMAKTWKKQGAERLHIVDLDGALAGESKNQYLIRQIIEEIQMPIEVGGGLRNHDDVAATLGMGAKWAIVGTKAFEDLEFIRSLAEEFGEQIIVSIDVKFKKIATHGWTKITDISDVEMVKKLQEVGVTSFIYTDISRDGTLTGVHLEDFKKLLEETKASMIYSGGISSIEDIKALKPLEAQGLSGVIVGKALYEDKIHLMQIKKLLGGSS